VFARRGYEAATVEEITAECGIAKGALYGHFASKEELFRTILVEHVRRRATETASRLEPGLPLHESILRIIEASWATCRTDPIWSPFWTPSPIPGRLLDRGPIHSRRRLKSPVASCVNEPNIGTCLALGAVWPAAAVAFGMRLYQSSRVPRGGVREGPAQFCCKVLHSVASSRRHRPAWASANLSIASRCQRARRRAVG
jgi:AcrR family transcriptional regulator